MRVDGSAEENKEIKAPNVFCNVKVALGVIAWCLSHFSFWSFFSCFFL